MALLLLVVLCALWWAPGKAVEVQPLQCPEQTVVNGGGAAGADMNFLKSTGNLYAANRKQVYDRDVKFEYIKDVSRTQADRRPMLLAGRNVFSVSETFPPPAGLESPFTSLPIAAQALSVCYNLNKLMEDQQHVLVLPSRLLPRIWSGSIATWNHPLIQRANPNITLPDERILVVAHAKHSTDTAVFTQALGEFDHNFRNEYLTQAEQFTGFYEPDFVDGQCCESRKWPADVIEFYADSRSGMIGILGSIPFTIGYLPQSDADQHKVTCAKLINKANKVVTPTEASVQAAMTDALRARKAQDALNSLSFPISDAAVSDAWPLASFVYLITNTSTHPAVSCCQAMELYGFVNDLLTHTRGEVYARFALVDLSNAVVEETLAMAKRLTCNGDRLDQLYKLSSVVSNKDTVVWAVVGSVAAVFILILLALLLAANRLYNQAQQDETKWLIAGKYVRLIETNNNNESQMSSTMTSKRPSAMPRGGGSQLLAVNNNNGNNSLRLL